MIVLYTVNNVMKSYYKRYLNILSKISLHSPPLGVQSQHFFFTLLYFHSCLTFDRKSFIGDFFSFYFLRYHFHQKKEREDRELNTR